MNNMELLTIRLPAATVRDADRLAQILKRDRRPVVGPRVTRSAVLREAIERGLIILASDLPKPRGRRNSRHD